MKILGLGESDGRGFWLFKAYRDSLAEMNLGSNVAFQPGYNLIRGIKKEMESRTSTIHELILSFASYAWIFSNRYRIRQQNHGQ